MSTRPAPRLYVKDPLAEGVILHLPSDQAHYVANVMRLEGGDTVRLFNGRDGEWEGAITERVKKDVGLTVKKQTRPQRAEPDIWLCPAPIRKAHFDYMIEKTTELGAARFQPVLTSRTQIREVNTQRLRALAIESAEQSERLNVPEIESPMTLEKLADSWPKDRSLIVCAEGGAATPLRDALQSPALQKSTKTALITGPEGGFTPEEFEKLRRMENAVFVRLGPRILRADTAAITALACWQTLCGDFK